MKLKIILLGCVLLLFLVQAVQAASSPNYRVDWTNLLSGSGGSATSAGYKVNDTIGQTVSGPASSPLYKVQWGFWSGVGSHQFTLYMPTIMKVP